MERVSPYVGIRIEGIGWDYVRPLMVKKVALNNRLSRVDKLGCTWVLSGGNRYIAFWANGRARGVTFFT